MRSNTGSATLIKSDVRTKPGHDVLFGIICSLLSFEIGAFFFLYPYVINLTRIFGILKLQNTWFGEFYVAQKLQSMESQALTSGSNRLRL